MDASPQRPTVVSAFPPGAFLWHPASRAHLVRQTKGSIMDGLNMSIIRSIPLPVPAIELQTDFAEQVRAIHALRSSAEDQSADVDRLVTALQARALSGRL